MDVLAGAEIKKVLVLSTGHLEHTDMTKLERLAARPDGVHVLSGQSSTIVNVSPLSEFDRVSEWENFHHFGKLSAAYKRIIQLAEEKEIQAIEFHGDGPVVDGLELFDW